MDANDSPTATALVARLDRPCWPVLAAAVKHLGFAVAQADLGDIPDSATLLERLGSQLGLPDWYGANFDALADCLSDPVWHPAPGLVLLIGGLTRWHEEAPEDFATLLDVLISVAEIRANEGQTCWILLDVPAPELASFVA